MNKYPSLTKDFFIESGKFRNKLFYNIFLKTTVTSNMSVKFCLGGKIKVDILFLNVSNGSIFIWKPLPLCLRSKTGSEYFGLCIFNKPMKLCQLKTTN